MIKLSIIVPVYKVEEYLDICVVSIVKQTLRDIEIILIDDDSPDNCPSLCDEWARRDQRIKVIHKKNGGLGLARNSGLDIATGEYVTFVDSDDYISANTYQYLLDKYDKSCPDVIYYQFVKFNHQSHPTPIFIGNGKVLRSDDLDRLKLDIIAAESKIKSERIIRCSACTSIYRREIIEKNGLRFHSERELVSEDMIFNLDFLTVASKVCIDDSVLYFYRENPKSLTHSIDLKKLSRFDYFDRYLRENLNRWGLGKEAHIRISRLLISTYRDTLTSILVSKQDLKNKNEFFKMATDSDRLKYAMSTYPWKHFGLYQKVYFIAMRYKLFGVSLLLSKIRSII